MRRNFLKTLIAAPFVALVAPKAAIAAAQQSDPLYVSWFIPLVSLAHEGPRLGERYFDPAIREIEEKLAAEGRRIASFEVKTLSQLGQHYELNHKVPGILFTVLVHDEPNA